MDHVERVVRSHFVFVFYVFKEVSEHFSWLSINKMVSSEWFFFFFGAYIKLQTVENANRYSQVELRLLCALICPGCFTSVHCKDEERDPLDRWRPSPLVVCAACKPSLLISRYGSERVFHWLIKLEWHGHGAEPRQRGQMRRAGKERQDWCVS